MVKVHAEKPGPHRLANRFFRRLFDRSRERPVRQSARDGHAGRTKDEAPGRPSATDRPQRLRLRRASCPVRQAGPARLARGSVSLYQSGPVPGADPSRVIGLGMAFDERNEGPGAGAMARGCPSRDRRRAAALRDNLKRRKTQARGRAEGAPAETPPASGRQPSAGQDGTGAPVIDGAQAAAGPHDRQARHDG